MNYVLLRLRSRFSIKSPKYYQYFIICEYKDNKGRNFLKKYMGKPLLICDINYNKVKKIDKKNIDIYYDLISSFYIFDKFLTDEEFWKLCFCELLNV